MSYSRNNGFFKASDGKDIFFQNWITSGSDKNIVLMHGAFEHSGRYSRLLKALESEGVSVWALDMRGHGKTEGKRGVVENVARPVSDIADFIRFLKSEHGIEKPVLLGHSLGGLLVLSFAAEAENRNLIRALATSGAAISVKLDFVMWLRQLLARYVLGVYFPNLVMAVGVEPKNLSHDAKVIEEHAEDPLVFDQFNLGFAVSILKEGDLFEQGEKIVADIPLYMSHGLDDVVTYSKGSEAVFALAKCEPKEIKLYPGLYHEIYNETEDTAKVVFDDLKQWLRKQF